MVVTLSTLETIAIVMALEVVMNVDVCNGAQGVRTKKVPMGWTRRSEASVVMNGAPGADGAEGPQGLQMMVQMEHLEQMDKMGHMVPDFTQDQQEHGAKSR